MEKKIIEDLQEADREMYHADCIQRARSSIKRLTDAKLNIANDDKLEDSERSRLNRIISSKIEEVLRDMDGDSFTL